MLLTQLQTGKAVASTQVFLLRTLDLSLAARHRMGGGGGSFIPRLISPRALSFPSLFILGTRLMEGWSPPSSPGLVVHNPDIKVPHCLHGIHQLHEEQE